MKMVVRLFLSLVLLVGLSLVGCSDDNQRITSPGTNLEFDPDLALDDDGGQTFDPYDYISEGFNPPEIDQGDNDTWNPGGHDYPDDDPPDKPTDNGLMVE